MKSFWLLTLALGLILVSCSSTSDSSDDDDIDYRGKIMLPHTVGSTWTYNVEGYDRDGNPLPDESYTLRREVSEAVVDGEYTYYVFTNYGKDTTVAYYIFDDTEIYRYYGYGEPVPFEPDSSNWNLCISFTEEDWIVRDEYDDAIFDDSRYVAVFTTTATEALFKTVLINGEEHDAYGIQYDTDNTLDVYTTGLQPELTFSKRSKIKYTEWYSENIGLVEKIANHHINQDSDLYTEKIVLIDFNIAE